MPGNRSTFTAVLFALAGLTPALATPANAQYFGRNKVQYQSFDFRILGTPHFDVYYYPEEQAAAKLAGRMAERWYVRLSAVLHHQLSGRQPVILYATQAQFQQTNVVQGLGEGTGAVLAVPLLRAACAMVAEMATFDSAGVAGKTPI